VSRLLLAYTHCFVVAANRMLELELEPEFGGASC